MKFTKEHRKRRLIIGGILGGGLLLGLILAISLPLVMHKKGSVAEVNILGTGGYGAVFNAQIDPFNANHFAATCDMGSVYFSDDAGTSWQRHDLLGTVYCLQFDPTTKGVIWAAGSGVYKSTDGGKTMQLVFPKPEEITAAGNNYENINYWLYTDKQSDYAPQYQIWSLAINRKSQGQNVFVAQKIPASGFGYQPSIRIYQTKNGSDFTFFTQLEYNNNFKLAYDEAHDCLLCVTPSRITAIQADGSVAYVVNQTITVQHASGNVLAFDSYYNAEQEQNTFVFATPVTTAHVDSACYLTHDLTDRQSYVDLTAKLCQLTTDDFGVTDLPTYHQHLASYEYGEWLDGDYVPQQFKWTISNVSILNDDIIYLFHEANYHNRRTSVYLKYQASNMTQPFTWVYGYPLKPYKTAITNTTWQDSDSGFCFGLSSSPQQPQALLFSTIVGVYYTADGQTVQQLNSSKAASDVLTFTAPNGQSETKSLMRTTTTGIDVICTQTVATDPFNPNHLLIGCTDIGLTQSYDNGATWYRALYEWQDGALVDIKYAAYTNTCFDLHFDTEKPGVVYGLWSQAKTAPYSPNDSYRTGQARFGISYDGGLSWTMKKITADGGCLPYRLQVVYQGEQRTIYVTTDSHGFFVTYNNGDTFLPMNAGIEPSTLNNNVVIWGNKLLVCDLGTFAVTGGAATDGKTQGFYQWQENERKFLKLPLPTVTLNGKSYHPAAIRDLVYDAKQQCLYLACTANVANNAATLTSVAGGIWRYQNGEFTQIYDDSTSVCSLSIDSQGQLYAAQLNGKLLRFTHDNSRVEVLLTGMFQRLKNIGFGATEKILYVPTWGGGTYRIVLHK